MSIIKISNEKYKTSYGSSLYYKKTKDSGYIEFTCPSYGSIGGLGLEKHTIYIHYIYNYDKINYRNIRKQNISISYPFVDKIKSQLSSLNPLELDIIIHGKHGFIEFLVLDERIVIFTHDTKRYTYEFFTTLKECIKNMMSYDKKDLK